MRRAAASKAWHISIIPAIHLSSWGHGNKEDLSIFSISLHQRLIKVFCWLYRYACIHVQIHTHTEHHFFPLTHVSFEAFCFIVLARFSMKNPPTRDCVMLFWKTLRVGWRRLGREMVLFFPLLDTHPSFLETKGDCLSSTFVSLFLCACRQTSFKNLTINYLPRQWNAKAQRNMRLRGKRSPPPPRRHTLWHAHSAAVMDGNNISVGACSPWTFYPLAQSA